MRKIFIAVFLFCACTPKHEDKSGQAKKEIAEADKDMSDKAVKEGFNKTLLLYADEQVVKPKEGALPIIGKAALEKYWAGKPDTKAISWAPYKTEAAQSGDMGYTLGNWKMITKDSTFYGNYYTIWKKQADGSWKFVVDGGNNTPKPE